MNKKTSYQLSFVYPMAQSDLNKVLNEYREGKVGFEEV
jgi:hypothetical protein